MTFGTQEARVLAVLPAQVSPSIFRSPLSVPIRELIPPQSTTPVRPVFPSIELLVIEVSTSEQFCQ